MRHITLAIFLLFTIISAYAVSYGEEKQIDMDTFVDLIVQLENEDMRADLETWTDQEIILLLSKMSMTDKRVKELYHKFKEVIVSPPDPDTYIEYSIENAEESLPKVEEFGHTIHNTLFAMSDEEVERYGRLLHLMRDVLYIDVKHMPLAIKHDNSRDVYWYGLHTEWLREVEKEYTMIFE